MPYNINLVITPKEDKRVRCRCCNKKVVVLKAHYQSKYCRKVRKILDKLTPMEVGVLKGTDEEYFY